MFDQTVSMFFSAWYIYLIFGMMFGSFLNVVIYRVPNGLSIVYPPSSCPKCGHMIKAYENIPVFGWIFLGGKCSKCKQPISIEYPIVELIVGLITLGLFFYFGPSLKLLIYIPLSYTLFCIMMIDFKTYSIPHGLNITILVLGILGVFGNFFIDDFLPVDITGSLLGAATGFGILYAIQIAGKMIYKQDAIGMGDLYMLGAAGLLMGPKLTFISFMLGSFTAVISHTVPAIINVKNRQKEAGEFKNYADSILKDLNTGKEESADILGLRLQVETNFRSDEAEKLFDEYRNAVLKPGLSNITYLRAFFRFMALEAEIEAEDSLKLISINTKLNSDVRKVIFEDLIGYDSPKDNFDLLIDNSKGVLSVDVIKSISDAKKDILKFEPLSKIDNIKKKLSEYKTENEKLEFLLDCNRYFQYSGFIAEQKQTVELIENTIDLNDSVLKQRYLSDLTYVYFTDFFFKESSDTKSEMKESVKIDGPKFDSVKSVYNLALFRIFFFKQRLAFGPFLAIGIMLSILYGERLIQLYFNFIKKLLI